ncbi:TLC domain-containing protein 5-like isoform X2 [Lineus longissimus]|uniref:TLC domain-containing protein 5-like isoform X2 n=1 Tax=Lineus longissimus TaxID=88925 RepID=UPI002B4C8328
MVSALVEIGLGVITCLIMWTALYHLMRFVRSSKTSEWHCRWVTMIHAATVTILSGYCGFIDGPWPFTDPGGPNTHWQTITVTVCLGYFIFDLTWCLYNKTEGPVMLLHHILSIFGMTMTLLCGKYGTEMTAAIFGSEISNPFLQMRWFIKETGNYQTWYAEINDALFMSLFGFMRIGVGSYLLYTYLNHPRPDSLGRFGALALYAISWIFWMGICRYAVRKYMKKYKAMKARTVESEHEKKNGRCKNGGVEPSGFDREQVATVTNGHATKSKAE